MERRTRLMKNLTNISRLNVLNYCTNEKILMN